VFGMGTGGSPPLWPPTNFSDALRHFRRSSAPSLLHRGRRSCIPPLLVTTLPELPYLSLWSSPRPISTSLLNTLPCLHMRPINLIFFQGSYPLLEVGDLILEGASRLDAFSVYPGRT
jgi:hypothetical protein